MRILKRISLSLLTAALTTLPAYAQNCTTPTTTNLVAHWELDETSGTTATDSAGSNNGTLQNGMDATNDSVTGAVSTALHFDGTDDRIDVGSPAALDDLWASGGTASVWLYFDSFPTSTPGVLYKTDSSTNGWSFSSISSDLAWFARRFSGVDADWYSSSSVFSLGKWHHLAVTYDDSSAANDPIIYVDGLPVAITEISTPTGSAEPDSSNLYIGNRASGRPFDGRIDDIRLYKRILSAEEIADLYKYGLGDEGSMVFNTDTNAIEYCDGTDWIHAGLGSYNANGVEFDGTSDFITSSFDATTTDDKKGAVSFWFNTNSLAANQLIHANTSYKMNISLRTGGDIRFVAKEVPSGTIILDMNSSTVLSTDTWYHLMASWDMSDPTKRHIYINDADDFDAAVTYTDAAIEYTRSVAIGGDTIGNDKFNGDIADFWFDYGTYIDLSIEENRRKFISASGLPMYLGSDGSFPTGQSPDIFLTGDTENWHTNKGAGGGFTENGALTPADNTSKPGSCTPGSGPFVEEDNETTYTTMTEGGWHDGIYYYTTLNNNGIGAYSFDGSTMTFVAKSADEKMVDLWGDGTYIYGARGNSTDLKAFSFDGSTFTEEATYATTTTVKAVGGDGTYIYMVEDDTLRALTFDGSSFTSVATITLDDYPNVNEIHTANGYIFIPNGNTDGILVYTFNGTSFNLVDSAAPDGYAVGVWVNWPYVHVGNGNGGLDAYSFDGTTLTAAGSVGGTFGNVWSDGTYIYAQEGNDELRAYTHDGSSYSLANAITLTGAIGVNGIYGDGTYIYTGANQYGAAAFSGFASCSCGVGPSGNIADKGVMKYNADYNTMQYCNGIDWVAMGPVGGTPPTTGLVGHWELDDTSGTTAADSAGSNDGTMQGGLDAGNDSVTGKISTAINFDGNDRVNIGDVEFSNADISVSSWVKFDGINSPTNHIVSKYNTSASRSYVLSYRDASNRFQFSVSADGTNLLQAGGTTIAQTGKWYHVAGTFDSSTGTVKIFVNGVEEGLTTNGAITSILDTTIPVYISSPEYVNGDIDDVRIYDRALTPAEINQLYYYGLSQGLGDVNNTCTDAGSITGATAEGIMFYNADHNVMQYCNGEEWIGIGQ